MNSRAQPYRVLFLCTGNSARSQMAEALLNVRAHGRFIAESAGSDPAPVVNPFAIAALQQAGIDWSGRRPRGTEGLAAHDWDLVITLCDRSREVCPVLPGRPLHVHWGMDDPAEATGSDAQKLQAFINAGVLLTSRISLLLALRMESVDRLVLEHRLGLIANERAPSQVTR